MKKAWLIAVIFCLGVIIGMAALFASCGNGGEKVTVYVTDSGKIYKAEGKDGMTVQRLLEYTGFKINDKDVINPDRDKVIGEAKVDNITISRYAKVHVTDGKKRQDVELMDGTVGQAIAKAGFKADEYTFDNKATDLLEDGMTVNLTRSYRGLVNEDGKTSYYNQNGELQKGGIVGSDADGYYLADKNGEINTRLCTTVTEGKTKWNIIEGRATKVESKSAETLSCAIQAIEQCTDSSMDRETKLKKAFDYIKTAYREKVPRSPSYNGMDWPIIYANDLLVDGGGDCYSYGAAFAYMGKAIGYENVYACNSGGHGWAEIEGKVYDPEWGRHHDDFTYFGLSYDNNETDVNYKRGIAPKADWMHIKIELN